MSATSNREDFEAVYVSVARAQLGLTAPDVRYMDLVAPHGPPDARQFLARKDVPGDGDPESGCLVVGLGIMREFFRAVGLRVDWLEQPLTLQAWPDAAAAAKLLGALHQPPEPLKVGCLYHVESSSGRHWRSVVGIDGGVTTVDGGSKRGGYQTIVEARPKVERGFDTGLGGTRPIIDWIDAIEIAQTLKSRATTKPEGPAGGTKPILRLGSKGEAVKRWQSTIGVSVDGMFGPATERATRIWQTLHGIPADGVVGPRTWKSADTEPSRAALKPGVDVSHWNAYGPEQWQAIKNAGHSWMIAKAFQRSPDGRFRQHVTNARAAGIERCDAYQYMQAVEGERRQQADIDATSYLTLRAQAGATDIGPTLDVEMQQNERRTGAELRAYVSMWLDTVRRIVTDQAPILYVEPQWWLRFPELREWDALVRDGVRLWIAHWDVAAPMALDPWGDAWSIWQHSTRRGQIPGITGDLDLNVARI